MKEDLDGFKAFEGLEDLPSKKEKVPKAVMKRFYSGILILFISYVFFAIISSLLTPMKLAPLLGRQFGFFLLTVMTLNFVCGILALVPFRRKKYLERYHIIAFYLLLISSGSVFIFSSYELS